MARAPSIFFDKIYSFKNHLQCMGYDERKDVSKGISFLEEAVLVALYGNWLITFIDNLQFIVTEGNRGLLALESLIILLLFISLVMYFITKVRRSSRLWWFHALALAAITVIEFSLDSEAFSFKQFNFLTVGVLFWILIRWVGDIRARLNLYG